MSTRLVTAGNGFIHKITPLKSGQRAVEVSLVSYTSKKADGGFDTKYLNVTAYADEDIVLPEKFERIPFSIAIEGLFVEKQETEKGVFIKTTGWLKGVTAIPKKEGTKEA